MAETLISLALMFVSITLLAMGVVGFLAFWYFLVYGIYNLIIKLKGDY